jgi:RNA polymerase sigma factor (sigma-70 family)
LPQLRELVSRFDDQASDRELLRRFGAERDEAAFAEVVRRHGPMLLRVCRRVLHNGHDAEDVCQAAFLLLAQKATSIRWHDSVAGWLFQTAYRLSLKARTAANRRARHEPRARPVAPPDPVTELALRELQAILDDELSGLPEKYRAPILLCCLEGHSRDEAARCLGWQLATVKDRLEQGRERLRARLARRGVPLGASLLSTYLLEGGARAGCPGVVPQATAKAALSLATGQATLAGLLPARVATLAKGVTTTMFVRKVTILVGLGIAVGLGAAGALKGRPVGPPPVQAQIPPARPVPAAAALVQPEPLPLVGHQGAVHAVAFAPNGKAIATAGADKTVRVWGTATGRPIHKLEQPGAAVGVAFSPDGKTLAAASAGKAGALVLWDAVTGKERWRSSVRVGGGGGAVAFSADGKRVAAGIADGGIWVFDVETGKALFITAGLGAGETAAAAFSPDGRLLAVGNGGGAVHLVDQAGRAVRRWTGKGTVTALVFLPGGLKVAGADGGRAVRILDLTTGKEEVAFGGQDAVRALALTANGKRVATAGASGAVRLWDASAGRQERRFSALGGVNALAFSPDGKWLATAGASGAVLWDQTRDEKPLPKGLKLTEKELGALWADLGSDEGGKAYAAARLLRADPARSVPFLQGRLKPKAAGPDQKKIKQLIADLDADEFEKRELATKELGKLGKAAAAELRVALAAGPSLEAHRRLEQLLKRLGGQGLALTPEQQREVRAVRVLEQVGTPEAKKLLAALVKSSPGWWVTREAKESLQRLARRDKRP